jgi:hypothetical protein
MRSDEFVQRWLAPDLGRLWEVATVLRVRPDGSDAATLRLELPRPAHFAAGQYFLVRMRVDAAPKVKGTKISIAPLRRNSKPCRTCDIAIGSVQFSRTVDERKRKS